jgi:hypothetical protein
LSPFSVAWVAVLDFIRLSDAALRPAARRPALPYGIPYGEHGRIIKYPGPDAAGELALAYFLL